MVEASTLMIVVFVMLILLYGSAVVSRYVQVKDKADFKMIEYFNIWTMTSSFSESSCPPPSTAAPLSCPPAAPKTSCPPAAPPMTPLNIFGPSGLSGSSPTTGRGVSLEDLQASSDFLKSLNDILQTTIPPTSTYKVEGYTSGDRIGIKTATVEPSSKIIIDGINKIIDLNKTAVCNIPNVKPEMLQESLAVFNPTPCAQLLQKIGIARTEATSTAGISTTERDNINAVTDMMTQVIRETCKPDDMITKDKLVTLYKNIYDSICN